MAVDQSLMMWLKHRYRGQAPSHILTAYHLKTRPGLQCIGHSVEEVDGSVQGVNNTQAPSHILTAYHLKTRPGLQYIGHSAEEVDGSVQGVNNTQSPSHILTAYHLKTRPGLQCIGHSAEEVDGSIQGVNNTQAPSHILTAYHLKTRPGLHCIGHSAEEVDGSVQGVNNTQAPSHTWIALQVLPGEYGTDGEGVGVFILGAGFMPLDLELVVFGDQLEVVVHVMKQRNAVGVIICAAAYHAVAVVLGLAIRQRQAVLAQLVGALQQVAVAVDIAQGRFAGIVGEKRVDALGLETRAGQGQAAHFRLHAVAQAFGGDAVDVGVGVVRGLVAAVEPAVDLRPAQVELVGDLALGTRVLLVGLALGAAVVGVDRVEDADGNTQAVHHRGAVGDLRGWERVRVAAADIAERNPAAIDQAEAVADLPVARQQFIEQDIGTREEAEVLADQHFAPLRVGHCAVELAHIDGGVGAVGLAVVDGHPERGTGAELEVVGLLGHVEAQVVGQKAHLHPGLAAVVLVTGAIYFAVDVEGVDVAIGGEGGFIFVVQHDFGVGERAQAQADEKGR